MRYHLFLTFFILTSLYAQTEESTQDEKSFHFTGRVSRINQTARLARIRTDFANIKFLNKRDRVIFWNDTYPQQKCYSLVEGKTNDYLLLNVPQMSECLQRVHFSTGSYLHFESDELKDTLKVVKELVDVLQKKRLALVAKKERHRRELDGHVEKVNTTNKRFEILRQKLEIEWQKELADIEEDKARNFTEFKNAEARLNEIEVKLESYRIDDHNLKLDRWALDPKLYEKK